MRQDNLGFGKSVRNGWKTDNRDKIRQSIATDAGEGQAEKTKWAARESIVVSQDWQSKGRSVGQEGKAERE